MPSLRRSLIIYFLLLTAVALGGVGVVTHQMARNALHAREQAETTRITQEYDLRVQESSDKFDEDLHLQAQSLGRELREKYSLLSRLGAEQQQSNFRHLMAVYSFRSFGSLGGPFSTVIDYAAANHTLPNSPTPTFRGALFWAFFSNNQTDELIRRSFEAGEHPDYFQFNIPRLRRVIRGPRMTFTLPADVESHLSEPGEYHLQDVTVPGVGELRRVVLRQNLPGNQRGGFIPGPPPQSSPGGPQQGPPSPPRGGRGDRGPTSVDNLFPPVYVQCAKPKRDLQAVLDTHADNRNVQLANVQSEIRKELGGLRLQLAGIAGLAFVGVVIGGWLLIGVGLSPLRKLSDAVSQVSERDFHLPVKKEELNEELVPIHDHLTQSLAALKRAFDREKEAVADISHELRTPVAGLLATIDVSLRKPRTAEQYKQTLEDCRGITKQLSGLVERVMTLAYLDAGQTAVSDSPTDAAELATDCAAVIRPLAESHGLTLTTDVRAEAELITDPDKLREVMMNLLHNAVEYTNPGGAVRLSVRREPNADRVVVEVSDTGIGMTPDVRTKIFERFYRADPSRTATGVHAGLGLAIVKEYVDRLGGTINVESEPGRGSTFRVSLPA